MAAGDRTSAAFESGIGEFQKRNRVLHFYERVDHLNDDYDRELFIGFALKRRTRDRLSTGLKPRVNEMTSSPANLDAFRPRLFSLRSKLLSQRLARALIRFLPNCANMRTVE
jgi:hypothetical protein